MWTAGIVVFVLSWLTTHNVLLPCCLTIGYYAVALTLGFLFRKMFSQVWISIAAQIVIAACLVAGFYYFDKSNARNEANSDIGEQTADSVQDKDYKVREFAIKEAPSVWKAYQFMSDAIGEQDGKISELRKTLEMFDASVDGDVGIRRLSRIRDELIASRDAIKSSLDEAYIQSRKFAAAPDRKEYDELRKKAIEDGVKEAQSALQKYKVMKGQK